MIQDFLDFIYCFEKNKVEYIVVGAHAMSTFGYIRATGDLDIFIEANCENANKVFAALKEFGAPLSVHKITPEFFAESGSVYQIGIPPARIDVLTKIDGITFAEAKQTRLIGRLGNVDVPILSLDLIIINKEASGRPQDLIDVQELKKIKNSKIGI